MTNYERIKNMSVDELTKFFANHTDHYCAPRQLNQIYEKAINNITGRGITWIDAIKQWLESEVTEE
ncbi:MAG: hypothetical protein E7365_06085 [Clostridiales bacterium]|nr:hypothetical protein [Clostridiales bacterium]